MSFSKLITHRCKAEKAPELYDMTIDKSEPFLGLLIDWGS